MATKQNRNANHANGKTVGNAGTGVVTRMAGSNPKLANGPELRKQTLMSPKILEGAVNAGSEGSGLFSKSRSFKVS